MCKNIVFSAKNISKNSFHNIFDSKFVNKLKILIKLQKAHNNWNEK